MAARTLQGPGFSARLVRSARRKTLAIHVRAGEVVVRAPLRLEETRIRQFLQTKTAWINKHLQRQSAAPAPLELRDGASLPFLGRSLVLSITSAPSVAIRRDGDTLMLQLPEGHEREDRLKQLLAHWLCHQAVTHLSQRVAEFAPALQVAPKGLKVRFYKSRWGSCNRRGELQFNWLIMCAPPEVVDYVVVHELCHLRHFDHSPAFWAAVASILPGYSRQRQWLKQQTSLVW